MTERRTGGEEEFREEKKAWEETLRNMLRQSREVGIPPLKIEYAHQVRDFGDGKLFMIVKAVLPFPRTDNPAIVNTLVFQKNEEDGGDGQLVEIGTVFSAWYGEEPKVIQWGVSPVAAGIPLLDNLQMAQAAHQVVKDDSAPPVVKTMPFTPNTTKLS